MPARLVRSGLSHRATVAALVVTAHVAAFSLLVMLTRLKSLPEVESTPQMVWTLLRPTRMTPRGPADEGADARAQTAIGPGTGTIIIRKDANHG
jgi:hypothetical protein